MNGSKWKTKAKEILGSGYVRRALEHDPDVGVSVAGVIIEWCIDGMEADREMDG